jgi:hypothetical protein
MNVLDVPLVAIGVVLTMRKPAVALPFPPSPVGLAQPDGIGRAPW